MILTVEDLATGIDAGEQILAVLPDFSKAFDKVPHQRLLLKVDHYGICGEVKKWILSFLEEQSQSVIIYGHSSFSKSGTSGVPQ